MSERRETVWSISGLSAEALRGSRHCTRGPEGTYRWCTSSYCFSMGNAG